jgi:ubiquitin carboxyl-terminal hydrolase L3
LGFQDVLSLDDLDVLAFLPRPVYALILVFPTTNQYEKRIKEEDNGLESCATGQADREVLFFEQTINNACGLYAIVHAVCNGEARSKLSTGAASSTWVYRLMASASGSIIDKLRQRATSLELEDLALVLEADQGLEQAYADVAQKGDTEAPNRPEDEVDYHYICFVKSHKNDHLYQLDGDRRQPIDLGVVPVDEDVLSDKCVDVIRGMMESEGGNANFSLMALVPTDL